jgi:SAM-dependent methyltransferase
MGRGGSLVHRVVRYVTSRLPMILICDEPADGAVVTLGAVVEGWAFSPAGIKEVSVWLDGQKVGKAEHGLERPDVARDYPGWPGAGRSGFRYRLEAFPETAASASVKLTIVAEDRLGRRVEVRRYVQAAQPTMAGSLDIPTLRPPEDPLREMGWSSPLVVFGWAVDPQGVDRIDVLLDGRVVGQADHGLPREDVEGLRREYRRLGLAERSGWLAVIRTEGFGQGEHKLAAIVHGRSGTLDLGPKPIWLRTDSVRVAPLRQRRLQTVLRCPQCRQPLVRSGANLVCSACGRSIRSSEFGTLLFEDTYADLDWRDAVGTSHSYPPEAIDVILDCRDDLVLDIGAGLRENLPNVIQLDAIAFPTTDVSANAEALPFADESFDGVIACNLLEHVSQSAAVVREMRRVCKMGGRIYADFTSVHPYHGFPHHYFNATETGLDWLMREIGGATGAVGVADARITVRLVLQTWLGSLENADARDLAERLPVGDLVALLENPTDNPDLFAAFGTVFPNGRRLIPPKVTFAGVRTR